MQLINFIICAFNMHNVYNALGQLIKVFSEDTKMNDTISNYSKCGLEKYPHYEEEKMYNLFLQRFSIIPKI